MNPRIQTVIDRLEAASKQGESYDFGSDGKFRHGWRNPIRADTGALLKAFVVARNPGRILEIGTAYGLSGLYLAASAPGHLDTIEFDEKVGLEAQKNFDEAGVDVTVHIGDAVDVIRRIARTRNGSASPRYSCVFLDAEKSSYQKYLDTLLELRLLMPNCLILADNVIDRKTECAEFLKFMERWPHEILPTECGLLVGRV